MQRTIFNTPAVKTLAHWLARILMKITGWKPYGQLPLIKKYVMIAAPHTSNWDFFYGMIMCFYFKTDLYWMGKKELFRKPFGWLMKWLGGIPVDRSRSTNLVSVVIDEFKTRDSLVIAIPPEGSRSRTKGWKTGFYYIASGAGVPILPAFLDFEKKSAGFGPLFHPTGNIENDMLLIKGFYKDIRGKHKNQAS